MIAYYAHQHGSGHSNYAQLFALRSPENFIIFTSYAFKFKKALNVVLLPSEDPDGTQAPPGAVDLPDYLHYSPVGQHSIQQRSADFITNCVKRKVKLVIVDVSVEIAALCRAASLPYAYVRLPGRRNDAGHLQAYQGAVGLLAYFPESLEDENTPEWIRKKTRYLGFFNRFEVSENMLKPESIKNVVIISGGGGHKNLEASLLKISQRFKNARIDLFGDFKTGEIPSIITVHGYHQDLHEFIRKADVVVANCGLNTISELLHLQKVIIAIPEDRPYQEQEVLYKKLVEHKLACPLEQALELQDEQILETTINPEAYLNTDAVNNFVQELVQNRKIWSL